MAQPDANVGRRRGRRVSTSLSEINVVPLVDVMLVLLIIFMVAAPMMQKGVEVNLPTSRRADKMTKTSLYVTVPASYAKDHRVYIDDESVPVDVLAERMRQAMKNAGPEGRVPARRRQRAAAAPDGRVRSAERRRHREGRHRGAGAGQTIAMDAVSEVLVSRAAKPDGLNGMVGASALAHLVLVAAVAFVPVGWFAAQREPEVVMQISLGGPVDRATAD